MRERGRGYNKGEKRNIRERERGRPGDGQAKGVGESKVVMGD